MHKDFVDIRSVDPSIQVDLMYYDDLNFLGTRVDGYHTPHKGLMTIPCAEALTKAQKAFNMDGWSIVVRDSYRPTAAVDHFVRWGNDTTDQKTKKYFYPYIDKNLVFEEGYVGKRSTHSRGSTVDITLVKKGEALGKILEEERLLNNGERIIYIRYPNEIDTGVSVDYFGEPSHPDSMAVPEHCRKNKLYIKKVMEDAGFKGIRIEWWHFTLCNEPFPDTYFNFPIAA